MSLLDEGREVASGSRGQLGPGGQGVKGSRGQGVRGRLCVRSEEGPIASLMWGQLLRQLFPQKDSSTILKPWPGGGSTPQPYLMFRIHWSSREGGGISDEQRRPQRQGRSRLSGLFAEA